MASRPWYSASVPGITLAPYGLVPPPAPRAVESVPPPKASTGEEAQARAWVARAFTRVEDVVYIGLGILLAGCALALLASTAATFASSVLARTLPEHIVGLLDQILLVLMIVEILYTVQVSFREHTLVPEPFVVVALIAGIRRALVLTAEFSKLVDAERPNAFRNAMIELGLLTVFIAGLVIALAVLRRPRAETGASKG